MCAVAPCPDIVCPGDSIPVFVRGTFPDNCHSLRSIQFLPKIDASIGPPLLQILIDDGGCLARPCIAMPVAWSAEVKMPPLPPGLYVLPIQLGIASCTDSFPRDSVYRSRADFRVVEPGAPSAHACALEWESEATGERYGEVKSAIKPAPPDVELKPASPQVEQRL